MVWGWCERGAESGELGAETDVSALSGVESYERGSKLGR